MNSILKKKRCIGSILKNVTIVTLKKKIDVTMAKKINVTTEYGTKIKMDVTIAFLTDTIKIHFKTICKYKMYHG